jgi:hypothetical protein
MLILRNVFYFAVFIILTISIVIGSVIAYEDGSRYFNWRSLNVQEVRSSAITYAARHNFQLSNMCLYEVRCDETGAYLHLVSDLENWDVNALRERVWRRRFNKTYCTGATANIAIEAYPYVLSESRRAVWSFGDNGFHPTLSRFYSAAFSHRNAEACTPEHSIFRVPESQ